MRKQHSVGKEGGGREKGGGDKGEIRVKGVKRRVKETRGNGKALIGKKRKYKS